MKNQLTDLIVQRLGETSEQLKKEFFQTHPIQVARHFALDNLLPNQIAETIYAHFPKPNQMRNLKSAGECKLKYSQFDKTPALLKDIHFAIQDPKVVAAIEQITEIKQQVPDPAQNTSCISTLLKNHYINPHIDNSHDLGRIFYRTVNVLYYVSPNWQLENGGNYELWDSSVKHAIIVPSFFNRLVVMETNRTSWHGVNRVLTNNPRCCLFNYFFSEQSPEGLPYFNVTRFKARPEQKIRRTVSVLKDRFLAIGTRPSPI